MKRVLFTLVLAIFFTIVLASSGTAFEKTPTEKIEYRIRQMLAQIKRFVLLGNWSKEHAKPLREQVEAVGKQEKTYLKLNGTNSLTSEQVNRLNIQLNALSTPIPTTSKTKATLY